MAETEQAKRGETAGAGEADRQREKARRPDKLDKLDKLDKPDKLDKLDQLDKLAQRLENTNIAAYVKLSQQTGRILFMNFISGVARGLGFTVGTTIVLAVIYKVLSHLIRMNIPYLTEMLQNFIEMVQVK